MGTMSVHAVALNNGDTLTINAGVEVYNSDGDVINLSGSWFAMDTNDNAKISGSEKVALSQGTTGIVIGTATPAGASHPGFPTGTDYNAITAPWSFFGNTGSEYTTVGITGSTESGLNMSGWTMTWNGIPAINMGGGAWGDGFRNSVGNFGWSGAYGSGYILDYHATVPLGDPSGFGGVKYALHLEGCVPTASPELNTCLPYTPSPTPEASTYAMMLAGLGLVGFAARQRNLKTCTFS